MNLTIRKIMPDKHMGIIKLNGENVTTIPLRLETRKKCQFSLLFNIILEIPAKTSWQERKTKVIQIGMKSAAYDIVCTKL